MNAIGSAAIGLAAIGLAAIGFARTGAAQTGLNRLADETSPYLRRHAPNPVDWRPWGEAAFAAALASKRPLFVSVGYATCAGCRIMERESYADPAVAAALAEHFVAVKVDRLARPDVAELMARYADAMGVRPGWPLHVFLTPDGEPYYADTFLPREDGPGRPGILTVLASTRRAHAGAAPGLVRRAHRVGSAVRAALGAASPGRGDEARRLHGAAAALEAGLEPESGRLGAALLRFPTRAPVRFLLRYHRRTGDATALDLAARTLRRMASAPVRDPVGGGFHRAANAPGWREPHAEKRLCDNARLALTYLEAWQATGDPGFREVARESLDFLIDGMQLPGGGFVAAVDETAADPLVILGWNALAVTALARAGFALDEDRFVAAARHTAAFIRGALYEGDEPRRTWSDGRRAGEPLLEDLALWIQALLDLSEIDPDPRWLAEARALQRRLDRDFAHPEGGYARRARKADGRLPPERPVRDAAVPAGNPVAANNLLRLHGLTGEGRFRTAADTLLAGLGGAADGDPAAHAALLAALEARLDAWHEVVVTWPPGDEPAPLLAPLRRTFLPNRVLLVAAEGEALGKIAGLAPLASGRKALGGRPTAYVCRGHVCRVPAQDPAALGAQLAEVHPLQAKLRDPS